MGVTPIKEYLAAIRDTGLRRHRLDRARVLARPGQDRRVGAAGLRRDGADHARPRRPRARRPAMASFDLNTGPDLPPKTDYGIGCIGAGFIMRDIHLAAYARGRLRRRRDRLANARAREGGRRASEASPRSTTPGRSCSTTRRCEIVDIAYPPDQQLEIVREAASATARKGILAQKPVAFTLDEAVEMVTALRRGRHEARRQPQHALRPVDAGAEDAPRPRRARRAGRRRDRHERPARTGRSSSSRTAGSRS